MSPFDPAVPRSALDFCVMVGGKQRSLDGLTAVPLDPSDQQKLDSLLASYDAEGSSPLLEEQARHFLLAYREYDNHVPVLKQSERAELDRLLVTPQASSQRPSQSASLPQIRSVRATSLTNRWRYAVVALIAAVAIGLGFGGRAIVNSWQSGPPAGSAQQRPPAQQVAPSNTNLQNLKQDYGPWQQLTPSDQQPQTDSPSVLLLETSGYFASTKWTVSPKVAGWQQDISGNVTNVDVKGNFADITDADGTPYVVGINQPFIVSSNPGTVLRVDPTGNIFSMTLAQATAVRQPLNHK